jgi:PAS domain S-box-containing protein
MSTPRHFRDRLVFDGILLDITQRKKAEYQSKTSEEKFHKIFMTTPDCVAITRLSDGLIMDVNKGFEDIVGWKREIAIGTKSLESPLNFWVDLSEREFLKEELKAGRDALNHEFEFRRADGSVRTGVYSARAINIGGEEHIIFIMRDMTKQKRMEKELLESHKMKLMGQISSGVAHEVRNPLHAIQAISEAMALDMDEKSDYKEYLMHIKSQVERLSHLMNDLLALGKPIQSSQFCKALLADIADTAVKNWREAHPQLSQQVQIINNLQDGDKVLVDTNKIQQVIINLLENASQHSPKKEEILLSLDKVSENFLMVKIIDKGVGLTAQDQPRIFEPFYTTRKSGTGLGLSLCKHIIESHGGTIKIVNNENTPGCTALFTLPVYKIQ